MVLGMMLAIISSNNVRDIANNLLLKYIPFIDTKFIFSVFVFIFIILNMEYIPKKQNVVKVEYFMLNMLEDNNKMFNKLKQHKQKFEFARNFIMFFCLYVKIPKYKIDNVKKIIKVIWQISSV